MNPRFFALFLCAGLAGASTVRADDKPAAAAPPASAPKEPAAPAPAPPSADLATPAKLAETAPETYKARFDTTQGPITIEVTRSQAPQGADRFYNLVKAGFFTDTAFFRVIPGFMAQFGIHGDPKLNLAWRNARIPDDPVKSGNSRGALTFATSGPASRTTQMFINLGDNSRLDGMGFASFGKVTEGMDVVDKLNGEYGEGAPGGVGPAQGRVQMEGNAYLKKDFPKLDYIKSASIVR